MSKQIHFAGVSRVAGVLTFRTASSPARAQQLAKLGDTDIKMTLLRGETFTKSQAAKKLLAQDFSNDAEILALLTSVAVDDNPFKAKKESKPRTVKVKATKPRLIIGSVSVGADDAPYTPKQAAKIRAEFMKKLKSAYEAN
jgi:hypothetical protein